MTKKSSGLLMLALTVVLLTIISARIPPSGENLKPEAAFTADDTEYIPADKQMLSVGADRETPVEAPTEETPEPMAPPEGLTLSDWRLRMANNTYVLPSSFAPDVSEIGNSQYLDSRIVEALQEMLSAAEAEHYQTCVVTGYRPYSTQAYLFFGKASQIAWNSEIEYADAEQQARSIVAYPGTSEHQTGLAVDIMDSPDTKMIAEEAAELPVLRWLAEHCAEYGFILRYPEDKQEITGWYEPWHFRYVGVEAATYIMENNLCLEEFIALF